MLHGVRPIQCLVFLYTCSYLVLRFKVPNRHSPHEHTSISFLNSSLCLYLVLNGCNVNLKYEVSDEVLQNVTKQFPIISAAANNPLLPYTLSCEHVRTVAIKTPTSLLINPMFSNETDYMSLHTFSCNLHLQ